MVSELPTLSPKARLILDRLVATGAMYGLELVAESEGKLKRGTVYVTLGRMEEKGLIESYYEDARPGQRGPARRRYKVTGLGKRVYKAWMAAARSLGVRLVPA